MTICTWELNKILILKTKLTSELCSPNRKKAEARKTGGVPPPRPLTAAEELNSNKPVAEDIPRRHPPVHQMHPAFVSTPYSDFASYGSLKYSETESSSASEEEEDETLSAATEWDPERPREVCLNIMYSYWQFSTHSHSSPLGWILDFVMYTEVMRRTNGQITCTLLSFNRAWLGIMRRGLLPPQHSSTQWDFH